MKVEPLIDNFSDSDSEANSLIIDYDMSSPVSDDKKTFNTDGSNLLKSNDGEFLNQQNKNFPSVIEFNSNNDKTVIVIKIFICYLISY